MFSQAAVSNNRTICLSNPGRFPPEDTNFIDFLRVGEFDFEKPLPNLCCLLKTIIKIETILMKMK